MSHPFKIKGPDHVALTVKSLEASVNFYHNILGLELLNSEEFAAGIRSFLSVRVGEMLIDLFPAKPEWPEPAPGNTLNHFCLYLETGLGWEDFKTYLLSNGLTIKTETLHNWGAYGYGNSVYVLDPDSNSVELKVY